MTENEIKLKIREMIDDELQNGSSAWFYLSFADAKGFRGGMIVNAIGPTDALIQTHRLGLNPGGSVLTFHIPEDVQLKDEWKNRLLSFKDMEAIGLQPKLHQW